MKYNFYVEQFNEALKEHDCEYPLQLQIKGSKNKSKNMTMPFELGIIIKDWYFLHGHKI